VLACLGLSSRAEAKSCKAAFQPCNPNNPGQCCSGGCASLVTHKNGTPVYQCT
jgi:hypothetical protein